MDLYAVIDQMVTEENQLLTARNRQLDSALVTTKWINIFAILLGLEVSERWRKGRLDRDYLRVRGRQAIALPVLALVFLNAASLFQGTLTRAYDYD